MKIHKQYIAEWKSISDDVKTLAETISNLMWYKSENDSPMLDGDLGLSFINGAFPLYMETVFNDGQNHFGIDKIDIEYIIYFFDSIEEYNKLCGRIGNSEYDVDNNRLKIICGSIEGYFNYTVTQEIYHELNHVFEYGMGMEKRANLYDKVISVVNNKNANEIEVSMCKAIYYTFPHEQDAFAHQFYGLIESENMDGTFEELVLNSQSYLDFLRSKRCVKEFLRKNKNEVNNVLNYLGLDLEQFNKRIHFGSKRFEKKLRRVYERHIYELSNKNIDIQTESRKQMARMLLLKEFKKRYKNIEFKNFNHEW